MKNGFAAWCLAGVVSGGMLAVAQPAEKPVAPTASGDVAPAQVIKRVSDFYAGLQSFAAESSVSSLSQGEGFKNESSTEFSVAFARPNKLAVERGHGAMAPTVISDGSNVFVYVPPLKGYTAEKAPAAFSDSASMPFRGEAFPALLDCLIAPVPYESMMDGVKSVKYVGKETLGGTECHHLRAAQDEFDWDLWAAAGDQPFVLKVVLDMSKSMAEAAEAMPMLQKPTHVQTTTVFSKWNVNAVPAERFRFTPPPDARQHKLEIPEDVAPDAAQ
jgi:hypothetical protein